MTVHIPVFASWGDTRCDASGNVYFQVFTGSVDDSTVLKVSADGTDSTVYQLPAQTSEGGRNLFEALSVAPSGTIRILYKKEKTDLLYVGEFGSDGALKQSVQLNAPGRLRAKNFVAFDDGTVWLSAYYAPRAAEQLRGKQYVAIFDASGRLIKQLPSYLPDKHQGQTGAKTLEGNAALGKDGNLYLLGPEKIIVMSESGEVLRTIKFEKTNPQQIAMRVDVSDGLVAITLTTVDKNTPHDEYLVLDSLTGNPFGLYEVDPTAPSKSMLCFNRQDGFTFLGGDKASVKFLHYALR